VRRALALFVYFASTLVGCSSLDGGRIVVLSVVARVERGRPDRPTTSGSSHACRIGVVAALTRPSNRLPPRPEPRRQPERRHARSDCRVEALCAFEAAAIHDALAGIDGR
jgi:hypothetical protein